MPPTACRATPAGCHRLPAARRLPAAQRLPLDSSHTTDPTRGPTLTGSRSVVSVAGLQPRAGHHPRTGAPCRIGRRASETGPAGNEVRRPDASLSGQTARELIAAPFQVPFRHPGWPSDPRAAGSCPFGSRLASQRGEPTRQPPLSASPAPCGNSAWRDDARPRRSGASCADWQAALDALLRSGQAEGFSLGETRTGACASRRRRRDRRTGDTG